MIVDERLTKEDCLQKRDLNLIVWVAVELVLVVELEQVKLDIPGYSQQTHG